jgi:hypothetical protein
MVHLPRAPDGRAGVYNRAGWLGRGWGCQQTCVNNARNSGRVVRSLLGGFGGGKLNILGVIGYNKPIWDVLALQGERDEASQRLWGDRLLLFFPIRQAVPVGPAWGSVLLLRSWGSVFHSKIIYITIYTVLTLNILFYTPRGRQEWVDGGGWIWMTRAINSIHHQSWRLGFVLAVGARFFAAEKLYIAI